MFGSPILIFPFRTNILLEVSKQLVANYSPAYIPTLYWSWSKDGVLSFSSVTTTTTCESELIEGWAPLICARTSRMYRSLVSWSRGPDVEIIPRKKKRLILANNIQIKHSYIYVLKYLTHTIFLNLRVSCLSYSPCCHSGSTDKKQLL